MSEQIRVALRDFGFMYLKNSGQMEAIAELRAAALEFFAQPEDAKVAAAAGQPGAVRGYYSERSLNTYKATGREGPPDYCSQFFMVIARTSSLPSPSPTFVPALAPSPLTHTHTHPDGPPSCGLRAAIFATASWARKLLALLSVRATSAQETAFLRPRLRPK